MKKEVKMRKRRFISALFFTVPLLYISIGYGAGLPLPRVWNPYINPCGYVVIQLILVLFVSIAGSEFSIKGLDLLRKGRPNADTLILMGTLAALLYSFYEMYCILKGNSFYTNCLYFDVAAVVLTLNLLGRYVEAVSRERTIVKRKKWFEKVLDNEDSERLAPEGAFIRVHGEQKILTDGIVVEGNGWVDESGLTGESRPVEKRPGDRVNEGSRNLCGVMKYQVDVKEYKNQLSILKQSIETAGNKRKIRKTIEERVATRIVWAVMLTGFSSAVGWYIAGKSVPFAFGILLSVWITACPCSLELAISTGAVTGREKALENGAFMIDKCALELVDGLTTVVLDKTGTITEGKLCVCHIQKLVHISEDKLLQLAASASVDWEHPLGKAIVQEAEQRWIERSVAESFREWKKGGAEAVVEGKCIFLGEENHMKENGLIEKEPMEIAREHVQDGKIAVFVVIDGQIAGLIFLQDAVKESSREAIEQLKGMGLETVLFTEDDERTANAVARQTGITTVFSRLSPEEKMNKMKVLIDEGRKTLMVGDGLNDTAAHIIADTGLTIGKEMAGYIDKADIVLTKSDLKEVVRIIQLSRRVVVNRKENLVCCFLYHAAGMPLAMGVSYLFGGSLMKPGIMRLILCFSLVSVLINALRFYKSRP